VRYLKRWKHIQLQAGAPHSIALAVAAYHWFRPELGLFLMEEPDDGAALLALIERMLGPVEEGRLAVLLPLDGELARDLLADMTSNQMAAFLGKLMNLRDTLASARDHDGTSNGLAVLRSQFGTDFAAT
jgi:hypothetical protein